MNRILVALTEMGVRKIVFGGYIIRTGFYIPMLRLLRKYAKDFYTGPCVTIPAVHYFLAESYLELVSESPHNFKKIVFRNSCFQVDVVGYQDRNKKILQVGFRNQQFSTGIDISLKENIVAFMPFPSRNTLKAEKRFALKVEMLELVEMCLAILARLCVFRIAHYTGRRGLAC